MNAELERRMEKYYKEAQRLFAEYQKTKNEKVFSRYLTKIRQYNRMTKLAKDEEEMNKFQRSHDLKGDYRKRIVALNEKIMSFNMKLEEPSEHDWRRILDRDRSEEDKVFGSLNDRAVALEKTKGLSSQVQEDIEGGEDVRREECIIL
jgi:hypothetical protein